jgi:hypothetical protein
LIYIEDGSGNGAVFFILPEPLIKLMALIGRKFSFWYFFFVGTKKKYYLCKTKKENY